MLKLKSRLELILQRAGIVSAEAESRTIVFHLFRQQFQHLRTFGELFAMNPPVTAPLEAEAMRIAAERTQGKPLQYILGYQFFLNHDYLVNDKVLVPRTETEFMVQSIIEWVETATEEDDFNPAFRFAELGLGSGCISTEILYRFKLASGTATEVSADAIHLAKKNLFRILGANWGSRLQVIEVGDPTQRFEALVDRGPFDLLVSNPPYVSGIDEIETSVRRFEPALALFPAQDPEASVGNENPNVFYESFCSYFHRIMRPGGAFFFEVPHERAEEIAERFSHFGFSGLRLIGDFTARPRILFGETPP